MLAQAPHYICCLSHVNQAARMTQHTSAPTNRTPNQHGAITDRLRALGLRATPQRVLVLAALGDAHGHLRADEIMRWVAERYPAVNLATIYRTLDTLVSAGLVTQTDLGAGAASFELTGETRHHHLVCEHCGSVTEMDDALVASLRERLLCEAGFRVSTTHLALFGICRACQEREHMLSGADQE
jgi:Fur family ferric uptake transcriptional regulator